MNLTEKIKAKKTFLCVGLDPDLNKIPAHFLKMEDPIFEFNKAIIDATKDICVASGRYWKYSTTIRQIRI